MRDLGLNDSDVLRSLVLASVVRKAGPDRYFLDEQVWARRRNIQGNLVVRIAVVLGLIAFAAVLYTVAGR